MSERSFKNRKTPGMFPRLLPNFLALTLATFWAVGPLSGAESRMTRLSDSVVEISGGTGKGAWALHYGTAPQTPSLKPHFISGEGDRAWYSYGGWLRLIDTQKGVVIGRWHFPGEVVSLTPEGTKIQVGTEEKMGIERQVLGRRLEFDPSAPHVPYWPSNLFMLYLVPRSETVIRPPYINPSDYLDVDRKVSGEEAKRVLPDLEEAVRRDPLTPWFRVALGKVLKDVGDPRATEEFQQVIGTPSTDYTELLPISVRLDNIGESDLARAAFERGYQDFWQRGNDPRMFVSLLSRLIIYSQRGENWASLDTKLGGELIERTYKLAPYAEGAELAWRFYADYLQANGHPQEAKLWRERAADAKENSPYVAEPGFSLIADRFLLFSLGPALAAILYFLLLHNRYLPQLRLAKAAQKRSTAFARGWSWLNTVYWNRSQRIAFFSIVVVVFFCAGMLGQYIQGILRCAETPLSLGMGSLGGPVTTWYLENRLPRTPERDLLLAIAYQQSGENEKAADLYRSLPRFAESWNNLGVILKNAGKDDEARQAFGKALELDPRLAEARLNLGGPPQSFWTELHQKYVPGSPMLAPPRRERMVNAFLGGSPLQVFARAWLRGFSGGVFRWIGKLAE